jgi:conjugative transfer pilus assembly protein TraH
MKIVKLTVFLMLQSFCLNAFSAGINTQMENMFSSMVNTMAPTASVDGVHRGIITGGGLTVRNRISNPNLVTFVPPSFEAGCGGLNFFGGSFSFISAAQFQQLLRNIASSAGTYAFKLALQSMCGACNNIMTNLQSQLSKMNEYLGNSCQLAQGIVNDTKAAIMQQDYSFDNMTQVVNGVSDAFSGGTAAPGQNARQNVIAAGLSETCKYNANLLWCAFQRENAQAWFAGGDNDLLRAIMSYTGTVIVKPLVADAGGHGQTPEIVEIHPTSITLQDLVVGNTAPIYECIDGLGQNQCLDLNPTETPIDGFTKLVSDLLLGDGGGGLGIIDLFETNAGALSAQQRNFIANLPGGVGTMIRNLSVLDPNSARLFATEATPFLALDLASLMMEDVLSSVRQMDSNLTSAWVPELKKKLNEALQNARQEKAILQQKYGSQGELYKYYTALIQAARHKRYTLQFSDMGMSTSGTK